MQSTAGEIARTLARGRLAATAHLPCRPPAAIRHATDDAGRPLLLCRDNEDLAAALRPRPGANATAIALCVHDQPPVTGAPSLGQVWVSGWARRIDQPAGQRAAVLEYAQTSADADLFDVGVSASLYRVEVHRVRLVRSRRAETISAEDYTAADPDPLHDLEADLLNDLADHHGAQLIPYLRRRLDESGITVRTGRTPRPVRLDRYGIVVAAQAHDGGLGGCFVRLPFARRVADRHDLAHLLHPVLFPHSCR